MNKKPKDHFNIKVTAYINRELEDKILKCCKSRNKGFSDTIRYLVNKGLIEEEII